MQPAEARRGGRRLGEELRVGSPGRTPESAEHGRSPPRGVAGGVRGAWVGGPVQASAPAPAPRRR